jgi:hypothetical protein
VRMIDVGGLKGPFPASFPCACRSVLLIEQANFEPAISRTVDCEEEMLYACYGKF